MGTYLFLDFLFIFVWLLSPYFSEKLKSFAFNFLVVVLVFISSFRGNFTSDYDNYVYLFDFYKNYTLKEVFSSGLYGYPELGYLLWQYVVNKLSGSSIALFVTSSLLIVLVNGNVIKNYSEDLILGLFLFLEAGNFYTSFNITRQIMAAAVALLGVKYLIEKKWKQYFIIVFIASLFHKTALVMIPIYFVSHFSISIKSFIRYCVCIVLFWISSDLIIELVQKYAYSSYMSGTDYMIGYGWKNAIVPSAVSIFGIISTIYKKNTELDYDNEKNRVFFNLATLNFVFSVLGLKVMMFNRISYFFSTYSVVLATNGFSQNGKSKRLLGFCLCILLTFFGYLAKDTYPYRFIWG